MSSLSISEVDRAVKSLLTFFTFTNTMASVAHMLNKMMQEFEEIVQLQATDSGVQNRTPQAREDRDEVTEQPPAERKDTQGRFLSSSPSPVY